MDLFFVASRGLTATTWFSNALNIHNNVFCSHGRDRPGRGIETDSLLLDESYRIDRLEYEKWQREAKIDDYVKHLSQAAGEEKFIGNVHGYVLIELMDKLSKSKIDNVVIANMIRHPFGFADSYTSLVVHRKQDYPEKFSHEHGSRIEKNRELIDKYQLDHMDLEMLGFVEACQALQKSANEIRMFPVYTIMMERLVSDQKYFLDVFKFLTKDQLHYDVSKLSNVVKVNSHKDKHKLDSSENEIKVNSSEKKWFNWSSEKKEIFLDMLSVEDVKVFRGYGYSMQCLKE